ncbi:MAG: TlpA disulfide reductase family protein [Ignavibacteria bacterium]|jgi:peroxiredoxin
MKRILLLFIFLKYSIIFSQVITFLPEKPYAGDTLSISYNPYVESSKFSINNEVYAIIWEMKNDGNYEKYFQKMERNDSTLFTKISVNEVTAKYIIYFITLSEESWDPNSLEIAVYNKSNIPIKYAYYNNYEEEIKYHPDNLSIYRDKWLNEKSNSPEKYKGIIRADMNKLPKENTIDVLFCKSLGYLLLDEKETSLEIIRKMITDHPEHQFTFAAVDLFLNELFSSNYKGPLNERLKNIAEELVMETKNSLYTYELVGRNVFDFSDSCKISICENWMKNYPDNPVPYLILSYVYKDKKPEYAKKLIMRFIDLSLVGKYRLYKDVMGLANTFYLREAYSLLSEISKNLKDYTTAIAAIKMAQSILTPTDEMYLLEGDIWFQLGNIKKAEDAFIKSWHQAKPEAKDRIFNCYKLNHNTNDNFDEYLMEINNTEKNLSKSNLESNNSNVSGNQIGFGAAKPFKVCTMKNDTISLSSLKGKIVVMKFWYINCAPCRQEIPELNKLVEKYDKDNVVFLAFALDDRAELNNFLDHVNFDYEVIPNANKIVEDYGVKYFPSHFIVNQIGEIVFKQEGGGSASCEKISRVISKLL